MLKKILIDEVQRITFFGALINFFLACLKLSVGLLSQSQALIADGVHSYADLLSDLLVAVGAHFSKKDADLNHPYGHGRIETAATFFLSLLLILAGVGIAVDSAFHIHHSFIPHLNLGVLFVAFISWLAQEGMFHFTKKVGEKKQSAILIANAWHHRSDAWSSLVVIVGTFAHYFGIWFADPLAAIVIGFFIIKLGAEMAWENIKELVDTGVDFIQLKKIEEIISSQAGVSALHQLRTRSMGHKVFVDVHILVHSKISVSEGHHIAQKVHFALKQNFSGLSDVIIHIDPEDDEYHLPSAKLPDRNMLQPVIEKILETHLLFSKNNEYLFHYLAGELEMDVILSSDIKNRLSILTEKENTIKEKLMDLYPFNCIRILQTTS